MHTPHTKLVLASFVAAFACGPGLVADGDDGGETETTGDGDSDADSGDGDGDGDDDGGDGDGDGDGDDNGDGDADTSWGGCNELQFECPDGTCVTEVGRYICCGFGGECPSLCEPQEFGVPGACANPPWYGWTGDGCEAICDCIETEWPCEMLFESVWECFAAHEPTCGQIGLDSCPFETKLGPTGVTGTTSWGPRTYEYGVFGQVFGRGGGIDLNIALAADPLSLGNHLWNVWGMPPETADVLKISGGSIVPGEYQVWLSVPIPLSEGPAGTLTITTVEVAGAHPEHQLWATLDVSEGEWELHGEFAIPGCAQLEIHLP